MLLQLNIKNFAIVRSLELEWRNGMTTITGETGAGKSIAIDALGLCLGARAVTNVVRPNTTKAELSATFAVNNNLIAKQWLINHDLMEDDECILRRVVSAEGRSRAYINGSQVPLTQLKELGATLLSIHGQHDHQLIVKSSEQRRMLDAYADHKELGDDVKYYYQQWHKLSKECDLLQQAKSERVAKQELLQYQVRELDEFSIQTGEFEQLEKDYKRHSNAQDILNKTLATLHQLSENEQFNVIDNLRQCSENLNLLCEIDAELNNTAAILSEALVQIEEANNDLSHYYEKLELDPEAFSILEERYSLAIKLAKKHQVRPENLTEYHQELTVQLAAMGNDETRLNNIIIEIEHAKVSYFKAAKVLSESRVASAHILSEKISQSMHELNMPNGIFQISVNAKNQDTLTIHGFDDVEFLVSINPGQQLESMHKVASGGELSRISLAMQVILAGKVISPTLIFDEVDVGISGPTAAMVGEKLQQLAANTQIICVTHLPQVACKGHQQMFVAKLTDGEHTETTVTELSSQARVQEIARLLAGNKISEHSLANAKELLAS
ncbi:MAG: DNA repair protein RecN [Thalassotalea sp.]